MGTPSEATIYTYTRDYLQNLTDLQDKVVVDVPAGSGRWNRLLKDKGARVKALDLYPEGIEGEGVDKLFADMNDRLPLEDETADVVICQEGIEHVHNQLGLLGELNRILKPGGRLLLTTPSISHARARLSMLLIESEYWKRLPASEANSVWLSEQNSSRLYFGHLYLVNVNQLRALTALSGFEIEQRIPTKRSASSVILGLLMYPFMGLAAAIAYGDTLRKEGHKLDTRKRAILKQQIRLNLSPTTLFCKDNFWVLRKRRNEAEMLDYLRAMQR